MGKRLVQPEQYTYYICWDDSRSKIQVYSGINTNQPFTTCFDVVDYYTDKSQWEAVLLNNGVSSDDLIGY